MLVGIGRRQFIAALGGAALVCPLAARAQQSNKLPTIGVLLGDASSWRAWTAAFAQRLSQLGWIEGRTVPIEYRWSDDRPEDVAKFAAELVQQKVALATDTSWPFIRSGDIHLEILALKGRR
jgi:putative ABC transport system substrate-binding protein